MIKTEEFEPYFERCIQEYSKICQSSTKIDAGHSINHVKTVEAITRKAAQELEDMVKSNSPNLKQWTDIYPLETLTTPSDFKLRIAAASLLHEVGDKKLTNKEVEKTKKELIFEALDIVFQDYIDYSQEMKEDIYHQINISSASGFGDQVPEGTHLYQLIVRWADRFEATGPIGIVRCLLYGNSRSDYPLVNENDSFPTTQEELEAVAPISRFHNYTKNKGGSRSSWEHFQDKIRHIGGDVTPIPCIKNDLSQRQRFTDQFILDFTNIHGKKFDMDWIISSIDHNEYTEEVQELIKMKEKLLKENCKWIK